MNMNVNMNRIKIFVGPGRSGKTKSAIQLAQALMADGQSVLAFKSAKDIRGDLRIADFIIARDGTEIYAVRVEKAKQILETVRLARAGQSFQFIDGDWYGDPKIVLIDEAQFFDRGVVGVVQQLMSSGKKVIITGLARDCFNRPFRSVPALMALAEHNEDIVIKEAMCAVCGQLGATQIQRLSDGRPAVLGKQIIVGEDHYRGKSSQAKITYEPRCNKHHQIVLTPWWRKLYFNILYRLQN